MQKLITSVENFEETEELVGNFVSRYENLIESMEDVRQNHEPE